MTGLNQEEKKMALKYASRGATFKLLPSEQLSQMFINKDPRVEKVAKYLKGPLMQRKPIRIDSTLVVNYCLGKLDSKNQLILDNSHIEVIEPKIEIFKK